MENVQHRLKQFATPKTLSMRYRIEEKGRRGIFKWKGEEGQTKRKMVVNGNKKDR